MPYKRPEDHLRNFDHAKAVKELQEYQNRKKPICGLSIIINYRHLMFSGVEHAGTLAHICNKDPGHEGKCKCKEPCGVEFQGWR